MHVQLCEFIGSMVILE